MTNTLNVHTSGISVANQKSDVKKYMENLRPDPTAICSFPNEPNGYGGSVNDAAHTMMTSDIARSVWLINFCHRLCSPEAWEV